MMVYSYQLIGLHKVDTSLEGHFFVRTLQDGHLFRRTLQDGHLFDRTSQGGHLFSLDCLKGARLDTPITRGWGRGGVILKFC